MRYHREMNFTMIRNWVGQIGDDAFYEACDRHGIMVWQEDVYKRQELGMVTSTPTRKEDVKDPIGITGWPKEKGRDGERTPMQWTPGPQAGFSANPHTWLPIPPSYKSTNVQTEQSEPNSQLAWFEALITLRRSNPALHDGSRCV